jgi:hypothetical protein
MARFDPNTTEYKLKIELKCLLFFTIFAFTISGCKTIISSKEKITMNTRSKKTITAKYGIKILFEKNIVYNFPDFNLEFEGMKASQGNYVYNFKINSQNIERVISAYGVGFSSPVSFEINKRNLTLELQPVPIKDWQPFKELIVRESGSGLKD